jgi:hypothetical protein
VQCIRKKGNLGEKSVLLALGHSRFQLHPFIPQGYSPLKIKRFSRSFHIKNSKLHASHAEKISAILPALETTCNR